MGLPTLTWQKQLKTGLILKNKHNQLQVFVHFMETGVMFVFSDWGYDFYLVKVALFEVKV